MKVQLVLVSVIAVLLLPLRAAGHELHHAVTPGRAIIVTITYPDHRSFANERYEIFRPGEQSPFQSGRSDMRGKISFLPDRSGSWLVKVFSKDGHGVTVTVAVDPADLSVRSDTTTAMDGTRFWRILGGLGVLFGIFGIITMFFRRTAG